MNAMAEDVTHTTGSLADTCVEIKNTILSPPCYELIDEIGHGGMGVVYRARDAALDRDVAVKLLAQRYPADSSAAQRFLVEARITGQLQHPGIPSVHQVGILADGRPFLAMKLIKGNTLETILKLRPDPEAERGRFLSIFEAVCQAVGYAHAHRVIHRDLKPANVMVGAFGEVQVMDWGLAKVLGDKAPGTADALAAEQTQAWTEVSPSPEAGSHTVAGSLVGTPAFIPPEQALGEIDKVNERSDVFGLGALLTTLLTGKPPYVGDNAESVRVQAVRGKLEDCFARLDASGAEPELLELCKKCLAFEPADRPPDAGAVAAAVAGLRAAADERARRAELERVRVDGEQATAAARSAERRKRRRLVLGSAAVLAIAVVSGLSAVLAVQTRANAELARANGQVLMANTALKGANLQLTDANERERQQFKLAMEAIKFFHGDISKDLLLKQRQFEKLRGQLLRGAADFYGKLEQLLQGRTDPESRAALGRAYEDLGELTIQIGNSKDALAAFEKAISVRRTLAAAPHADDRVKLDLARDLRQRGFLQEGISEKLAAQASYEEALDIVKSLKPADGMTEPLYLVSAKITNSIGWLNHVFGKEEDAVTWLRKSCTILDEGIASTRTGTDELAVKGSQRYLVNTLNALSGPLGALGRFAESLTDQQRALDVMRKLIAADPADPGARNSYASTYYNMGGLYRSMSRSDEAFSAFRKGLDVLEKLVEDYPAIVEYRRFQARCLNGCGDSAQELGRPEEALPYFRAALVAWKKVVDDNPDRYGEPTDLAATHNRIGWLLFSTGKLPEAIEQFEAARVILQQIVDRFPPRITHRTRNELSNILVNIAESQRMLGRLAEARANCDKAIAMRESVIKEFPEVLSYRLRMGECLLRSGQVRLAAGDVHNAATDWRHAIASYESLPPRGGEFAMFEAGCHALLSSVAGKPGSGVSASESGSEAERAIAILSRIVANGYHDPVIKNESCLDPLRGRDDFSKLLEKLVKTSSPAKAEKKP
jgi:tetratricopeptide (TPR) repeat protein